MAEEKLEAKKTAEKPAEQKTEKIEKPAEKSVEKKESSLETSETKVSDSAQKSRISDKTSEKIEKKETKKKKIEGPKKTEAVVNGRDLPISTKHSIAICNFIRGRRVDEAIFILDEVSRFRRVLPMKGEIPHRKGKVMSGRYPITAAKLFIKLLRQLSANATVNDIDLETARIECIANRASRPYKRFGSMKFKRTHVTLKLKAKGKKNG